MPTTQSSPQEDSSDTNNLSKKLKITPPTNENTSTTHNQEDGIQIMNTNTQTNNQTMDVEHAHRTNANDLRQWLRQNKPHSTNTNNNSNNDNAMEIDQAQTPQTTIEDDDTTHAGTSGEERNRSRCAIKLSFTAGESAITSCLLALTEFFQQFQRLGDRKAILLPWEEANLDDLDPITHPSSVPMTVAGISGYVPKFLFEEEQAEERNVFKFTWDMLMRLTTSSVMCTAGCRSKGMIFLKTCYKQKDIGKLVF